MINGIEQTIRLFIIIPSCSTETTINLNGVEIIHQSLEINQLTLIEMNNHFDILNRTITIVNGNSINANVFNAENKDIFNVDVHII